MSDEPRYRAVGIADLERLAARGRLDGERVRAMRAVAAVLPFRTNAHVVDELIDWDAVPDDPIFQLTFPQPGMLPADVVAEIAALQDEGAPASAIVAVARRARAQLNPHPAGQLTYNVPSLEGETVAGLQHKYAETVLLFPSSGQTCHAFCSYCFRWPQFVGEPDQRFGTRQPTEALRYLAEHPEVTDVILTGGDPMVMRTRELERFVEPLVDDRLGVRTIRTGTKALTYWPHRFLGDDGDAALRLIERVVARGRTVAVMAHVGHPRELEPAATVEAIRRVRDAGAVVYCQAPLVRHVNDDADALARLWRREVDLGCVPYYLFVERPTGASSYFEVPLVRAHALFRDALSRVSGLARTVRGPVMSATQGKVVVDGVVDLGGSRALALRYLQARDPALVGQPFLAELDERACWLGDLRPVDPRCAPLLACGDRPLSEVPA